MYLDIFPFQSRFELHLKRWHLLQKFDNICLSVCLFVCPAIENEINREVSSLCRSSYLFLASQYALEAMRVTESLSHWVTDLPTNWVDVLIDFTDVTLVSDDTYRRLYWCDPDDPDDPDESYLVMKVI